MKKPLIYGIFLLNLIIIFGFWWSNSGILFGRGSIGILTALGRVSGLLAVYFILLQFILIGRSVWLEKTFGLDKLSRVHHWNGFFSIFFIVLHPVLITFAYTAPSGSFVGELQSLIFGSDDLMSAFWAMLIFVAIVIWSISIVKNRLKYETWYFVHLGTYLAILLAFGHQLKFGEDFLHSQVFAGYWYLLYMAALGAFFYFRCFVPVRLFYRHEFEVREVRRETPDTVSIYITGKDISKLSVQPGQFMIFRFLAKGLWWQAHPFSLSEAPNGRELRITVKELGDFTNKVKNISAGTKVFIEGPYGVFTDSPKILSNVLLIAGGIGITPIRSLFEKMVLKGKNVSLLYGNKTKNDIVFKKEFENLIKNHPADIIHILSGDPDYEGEKGFIDGEKIKKFVPDVSEREVFVCGPALMMKLVVLALKGLGVPASRIHYEKFSL